MSLKERLADIRPRLTNIGCRTCKWLETLGSDDREVFEEWIDSGKSLRQLWEVCHSDPDNPLPNKLGAFQDHVRNCR